MDVQIRTGWGEKIFTYEEIIEMMDERLSREEKRGLKSTIKGKATRGKKVFKYL